MTTTTPPRDAGAERQVKSQPANDLDLDALERAFGSPWRVMTVEEFAAMNLQGAALVHREDGLASVWLEDHVHTVLTALREAREERGALSSDEIEALAAKWPRILRVVMESVQAKEAAEARALAAEGALASLWPKNMKRVPAHLADDFIFPMDVTAGELRAVEIVLAAAPSPTPAASEAVREALDWFSADHRLSLKWQGPVYADDTDDAQEWRVYRESGPINDREWDVVSAGETATAAILAAHRASLGGDHG